MGSFLLLVTLFAGWLLLERHCGKSALAKYERQLLAKGEKLTFAELVPPIPEGENKADEFLRLCLALQEGSVLMLNAPPVMKLIAPGKALLITKEEEWFFGDQKKSFRWPDAHTDLKANADTLGQLREISRSPMLRSTIQYRGVNTRLPHLASAKAAAQWLSASALYNVHLGNAKAAVDDIEAVLMFSRLFRDEPLLISQLVGIAIVTIAIHDCWPVLQTDNISEEQLVRLQTVLQDLDLIRPMIQAVRGERVMGRDTIHMLRSADTRFEDLVDTFSSVSEGGEASGLMKSMPYNENIRGAIRGAIIVPMWRFIWSYEDERHLLGEMEAVLATAKQAKIQRSPSPLKIAAKSINAKSDRSWRYLVTDIFLDNAASGPLRAFRFQAHNEMTIAAIALKRYHLRHRKYPQNLDELVPEFLPVSPVDWMDGQKLRYRPDGEAFVLWSVGGNGKDDGGKPDKSEPYNFLNGPDIVWPQPASAAEVQQYHERIKAKR